MVEKYITRCGYPIARIEPQGRMKRVTLLDGTFYLVSPKGRYMASGKHPYDVITHPDYRWFNRLYNVLSGLERSVRAFF